MSEFALQLHRGPDDAPIGIAGPAWITIDEAHRRSGVSIGRLRGNCPTKYEPRGMARKDAEGRWTIREDADERFAAVRSAAGVDTKATLALAAELAADPVQREIAQSRHRVMEDLQRRLDENARYARPRTVNEVIERFADDLSSGDVEVSSRTLKRWRSRWLDGGRDMLALVDERRVAGDDRQRPDDFEPYFEILRGQFLEMAEPKKSQAIVGANALARAAGIPVPHEKMAQRHLLEFERKNAATVIRYRGGPTAFANHALPYIPRDRTKITVRQADGTTRTRELRSDEIWCADHHVCDTIVTYKGKLIRPWLTAILDIRSNRIVGRHWAPDAPNKHNVLLAIRDAVRRGGNVIPDRWFVDNGKDFDAWMFQGATKMERRRFRLDNDVKRAEGILELLGIKTIHAAPYNARSKPVERFFGIYEDGFGKRTWTYCGRNPQSKPECLDQRLRNGEAMAFDEYCADADEWIYRVHHAQPLTSQIDRGVSRDDVYAANRTSGRKVDPELLDLLLMPVEKVRVTRMGVTFKGFRYHDPCLAPFIGQDVSLKVDPADVSSVQVWSMGMTQRIGVVQCLDLATWGDVSAEQRDKVNARIRSIEQAVKQVTAKGGVAYTGIAGNRRHQLAQVRRTIAEENAPAQPPPSPDAIRMVRTPLDDASNALRDGFDRPLKPAVGFDIDLAAFGEEGI